jgi:predicted nicotinamide N-methyase
VGSSAEGAKIIYGPITRENFLRIILRKETVANVETTSTLPDSTKKNTLVYGEK